MQDIGQPIGRQRLLGDLAKQRHLALLLDLSVAPAPCADLALIPRQDRLLAGGVPAPYAAWLGHSLWYHCPQAEQIHTDS